MGNQLILLIIMMDLDKDVEKYSIKYVQNRKGHDKRYGISSDK